MLMLNVFSVESRPKNWSAKASRSTWSKLFIAKSILSAETKLELFCPKIFVVEIRSILREYLEQRLCIFFWCYGAIVLKHYFQLWEGFKRSTSWATTPNEAFPNSYLSLLTPFKFKVDVNVLRRWAQALDDCRPCFVDLLKFPQRIKSNRTVVFFR